LFVYLSLSLSLWMADTDEQSHNSSEGGGGEKSGEGKVAIADGARKKGRKAKDKLMGKIGSGTVTAKPKKKKKSSQKKADLFLKKTNEAARKIQGMYLSWRARRNIRKAAASMYEEYIDPDTGEPYYMNLKTGETKWERPQWFNPPAKVDEEDELLDVETLDEQLKRMREEQPKDEIMDWPMVFPSGKTYEGMLGKYGSRTPEGVGVLITPNGGRYCGEFVGGKRHGWGVQNYPDGSTYAGEWIQDRVHGYGVKIEIDGSDYAGMFKLGNRSGLGVARSSLGIVYEGSYSDDMPDGFGVEWRMEAENFHGIAYRAGLWEKGLFQNTTPRFCCDEPEGHQTPEMIDDAKKRGLGFAKQARLALPTVYRSRKRANQARQRANDERKRTQLTQDTKQLALLKGAYSSGAYNPYITFLEVQLKDSRRRQRAAERRLRHQENMANLAEQQWTAARSFNDAMKKERDEVKEDLTKALEWQPVAEERWATIAEMRETLLQLRIALHIGKNQHRIMDRRGREAMAKAEKLQKKLNKSLANVNRSTGGKRHNIVSEYGGGGGGFGTPRGLDGFYPGTPGFTPLQSRGSYGARASTPKSPHLGASNGHQRYTVSRGGLTTAGSSVAGLSPPSSPVTLPGHTLDNIAPVPLYYSPLRSNHPEGRAITPVPHRVRAITPVPHGGRVPPLQTPQVGQHGWQGVGTPQSASQWARRPISPNANGEYVGQYLDSFHASPLHKKNGSKKSKKKFL
jgi:hypothetical protein